MGEREAIHAVTMQLGCNPKRYDSATRAVAYTLRMYQDVMPITEKGKFLRFLERGDYPLSYFTGSGALEFPIVNTNLPRNKQGKDRAKRKMRRHEIEGNITFHQSPASGLPFHLVHNLFLNDQISVSTDTIRIVDLCAAPGNKTLNMIHLTKLPQFNGVAVEAIVNDAKPDRLNRVAERLPQLGFKQSTRDRLTYFRDIDSSPVTIHLSCVDATDMHALGHVIDDRFKGFEPDIAIADVDCPGDGRIFTDPPSATRRQPKTLEDVERQVRILENAVRSVRCSPHGVVSYSTCSVNPLINEGVVSEVLKRNNAKTVYIPVDERSLFPALPEYRNHQFEGVHGVRAYPHTMGEGFFCSLVIKNLP